MTDNDERTALDLAVEHDQRAIVAYLLENGADANIKSSKTELGYNWRPLHRAIHNKNAQVIKWLLKYGADTNVRGVYGNCYCI